MQYAKRQHWSLSHDYGSFVQLQRLDVGNRMKWLNNVKISYAPLRGSTTTLHHHIV